VSKTGFVGFGPRRDWHSPPHPRHALWSLSEEREFICRPEPESPPPNRRSSLWTGGSRPRIWGHCDWQCCCGAFEDGRMVVSAVALAWKGGNGQYRTSNAAIEKDFMRTKAWLMKYWWGRARVMLRHSCVRPSSNIPCPSASPEYCQLVSSSTVQLSLQDQ
jgi:hypothetical protein